MGHVAITTPFWW